MNIQNILQTNSDESFNNSNLAIKHLATIPEEVAAFNAPEIYKGEAPSFGSDVYSLGAIAWLMIFGDTSFLGNYASDGRISFPVVTQGGAVPLWAHDVLSCALSEHSAERYSDVGAMIRALSTAKDRAASGENLPTKKSQSLLPMPSQQRLLVRNKPSPKEPIEEPPPPAPSFKLTLKMLPLKLANTKVYFDFEDDTFFYLLQSLFVCK